MHRHRSVDPLPGRPPRRGRARAFALPLALALLTQTAVTLGLAPAASATETDAGTAPAPSAAQQEESEALVTAEAQGRRIEVVGARTEHTTVWANPDGTMSVESSAGPVRYRENGRWADVDLTLVRNADGSVAPKGHPGDLRLAGRTGAAGGDLVTLGDGDQQISLGWKGALPKPRLDGTEATYDDVMPGTDLVVRATRTGFEQFLVVADREAAERAASMTLPVRAEGLKAAESADEGLVLTDADTGEEVGRTPTPFMWDSSTTHPDAPGSRTARVDLDVTKRNDGFDLSVEADKGFLADEDTQYPVTIDPAVYLTSNLDTEVHEGDTSDHSADYGLNVGREYQKTPARAFINFPREYSDVDITGQDVVNAELNLYSLWSDVCTPQSWEIWETGPATASTTWDTQPVWRTQARTSTQTFGHDDCGPEWLNEDVTTLVQQWSKTSRAIDTIGLRATDEDNTDAFKIFASSDSEFTPSLLVTFEPVTAPEKDHVEYWTDVLQATYREFGGAPGPLARAGAMVHGAVYDAANAARCAEDELLCLGDAYLVKPTASNGAVPDVNSAVDQAAHDVLTSVFPGYDFSDELAAARATVPAAVTAAQRAAGAEIGQKAAAAMIADRENDGSAAVEPYYGSEEPGYWRPTLFDATGAPVPGATPQWGGVKPFGILSGSQFRTAGPGGHTSMSSLLASPEYAAQVNDVKALGGHDSTERTKDQTEAAKFWANDLNGSYKPPGQLFEHTQILSEQQGVSMAGNAKLFALVSFAMADAAIVAWDMKYRTDIDLWRPETAIQKDGDGNDATEPDEDWTPLLVNLMGAKFSPYFPAYVSGHATFAGAWEKAVQEWFGTDDIGFTGTTDDQFAIGVTRHFDSISEAALENQRGRVWLGVHYDWDGVDGRKAGNQAASYIADHTIRPNTADTWVAYEQVHNLNGCAALGERLVAEHRWNEYRCTPTEDPEHTLYVR
ncbi:DNRLRE domain-containing protein [Streptomyces poonensis]|uniref:DNRLRE domain-containing protein n=1 Tax=Streptomyces poonensis TaxID=68255 RepID=A0A918USD9_9ACTN|nr:DNRLRE domain-containing protein [Streptomyces poonensis]GGZ30093.1 hypothetical protein GCM10010365_58200 [Streptomyces poonensis]